MVLGFSIPDEDCGGTKDSENGASREMSVSARNGIH